MELHWPAVAKQRTRICSLLLWFAMLTLGLAMMAVYAASPGPSLDKGPAWPSEASFSPAEDRPTLVVALHPRCTCSVATLRELERLLRDAAVRPRVDVLLYRPAGAELAPIFSDELRRLRGANVREDPEGRSAEVFGMLTSGDVALFMPAGRRVFRGGVTRLRGHEGESQGGRWLRAALRQEYAAGAWAPVFGCPLGTGG